MRQLALTALIVVALTACSPSSPPPAASAPAAKAPPAAAAAESKPAEAAVPAKEIPEGVCGEQSAVAADQRLANTARWSTASEQDNFGYEVFRSDSEKGEFKKLTKDPILGAGTSDETHKYEYRDDTIDPCREYWYYVESISTKGSREKFTPTFRAPAKRRAVGSPPPTAAEPAAPAKE